MRVVQFLVRLRPAFEALTQTTPRAPGRAVGECGTFRALFVLQQERKRRKMWHMEAKSNVVSF